MGIIIGLAVVQIKYILCDLVLTNFGSIVLRDIASNCHSTRLESDEEEVAAGHTYEDEEEQNYQANQSKLLWSRDGGVH